jgi:Patatin-like phospholipase
MTRTGQKTAFVFAGGGRLGAIQVGMLGVLISAGVQPDFVVGVSVGAMNAAYFAGTPNAEGVARLAEIWFGLRRREISPVTFKSAFGLLRHPESVIDFGGLRHLIEDNLAYARLASRIVVLPTGYACSLNEPPKGAIAKASHAITLLIEWRLIHDVERLADAIDVCIVPALCPLDVSPYDFSASRYLMERAEASTRKWLDGGGLSRRSLPQELEAHRH